MISFPLDSGEAESMGEYEARYALLFDLEDDPEEDPPPGFWKKKNGEVVAMADMSCDHIANTMAMLAREGRKRHPKYRQLAAERKRRKRAATWRTRGLR